MPSQKDYSLLSGPSAERQARTQLAVGASRKWVDRPFDSNEALRRLSYLGAGGCVVVLIFGLSTGRWYVTVSVGLMTACAAALSGVLLGFIFGVPMTRDGSPATAKPEGKDGAGGASRNSSPIAQPNYYRPNTSLEQISDWLAKMLVGVGLVEIKLIPAKLVSLAQYVAKGLGGESAAETFALGVLIYFSVCGFLFGFLWARIYLRRWFTEADEDLVRNLDNKLSKIEADAKAVALVARLLNRGPDDEPLTDQEVDEAIRLASTPIKTQIFEQAREASEDFTHPDHQAKVQSAISLFRALISSDVRKVFHRNHAELSYALGRQVPPDVAGALDAINEAIRRRDELGKRGWRYYELRRARYKIQQDEQFKRGLPSIPEATEIIVTDLKVAFASADTERWKRWIAEQKFVREWIEINKPHLS